MSWKMRLKLVWAVALSLAVFQFHLTGFFGPQHGQTPSLWQDYVSPWLSRVMMWAPLIAVGVLTGCLARPRRPERLAAAVAATGAFFVSGWGFGGPVTDIVKRAGVAVLLGIPLRLTSPHYEFPSAVEVLRATWGDIWIGCLPAAVACWLGAHYWRSESWSRFWGGPGGAILKGGLIAGAAGDVIHLARWFGPWNAAIREQGQAIARAQGHTFAPWWHWVFISLSGLAWAATITALLVSLRPGPALGAFAGSGVTLGVYAISELLSRLQRLHMGATTGLTVKPGVAFYALILVERAASGAIAGVFAGRWEDERIE